MTTRTEIEVSAIGLVVCLAVGFAGWLWWQSTDRCRMGKALRACDDEQANLAELQETMSGICIAATNNVASNNTIVYLLRRTLNFDTYGEEAKLAALRLMRISGEGTNIAPVIACLEQTNSPALSQGAFELLSVTHHPEAAPFLLEWGTRARTPRRAALYARLLGARRQTNALPLLAQRIHSQTPEVRAAALSALADWGEEPAFEVLKNAGRELPSPELWVAQIHCISRMGRGRGLAYWGVLSRFYDYCPGKVRAEALAAMVSLAGVDFSARGSDAPGARAARLVCDCFRSSDAAEHAMAMRLLSASEGPCSADSGAVARFLLGLYAQSGRRERADIWAVLKARGAGEGADFARALIAREDTPMQERLAAVSYLAGLQDGRHLPFLLSRLLAASERLPDLVNALYDGVLKLKNEPAITNLVAGYSRYTPLQQIRTLVVLSERKSPLLISCFQVASTYSRPDVRDTAVRLAQALPEPAVGAVLDAMLRTRPSRQRDMSDLLLEVAKVQPYVVAQIVEQRLPSAPPRDRFLMAELLRGIPVRRAVELLEGLSRDADPTVARTAHRAIESRRQENR
ncbi:MAG: hypothetical protein SPK06_05770 [Kiritimatiellia bacterium]|nr:hypothetical protein [Kiritimatiellia bacterium]